MQASCAFPDPPWLWSASCIARRMRTWGSLAPARRRYRQFRHISAAPFALSVCWPRSRPKSSAEGFGARRYVFHPDEMAEAEAQGLPYVLLPRVLSSREWMERYGEQPAGADSGVKKIQEPAASALSVTDGTEQDGWGAKALVPDRASRTATRARSRSLVGPRSEPARASPLVRLRHKIRCSNTARRALSRRRSVPGVARTRHI